MLQAGVVVVGVGVVCWCGLFIAAVLLYCIYCVYLERTRRVYMSARAVFKLKRAEVE